jgi:release factor glutamine methyltransferase
MTRRSVSRLKQPLWHKVPARAGDALQAARARLAATSGNPRRDAEVLLAYLLGCDQAALLTHPERLLSPAESDRLESLLKRRVACEPMQYITGSQEFFGLLFEVTPDVLIPRPETEHLVEAALEHIGRDAKARVLDVGAGSGAIAVALAHARPRSQVAAVDLSPAALEVARRNAQRHGVLEGMVFLQSDLLSAIDGADFDLVVSNPPYIAEGEVLEPQVFNYEPHSALYAGPTGLEVYERLIPQAHTILKPGGWLLLEIGFGQQPAVEALLSGWGSVGVIHDLQGIPRVLQAMKGIG